jgi:TetR/AcrR family transcriptional regulator, transcriptional repressor for nem operon
VKTKKGEKEKLRRVILEKAISFFKKNGRSGSASEDIMKYMGLTRGALYSHFKSKDDLFAHAVSHDLGRLEEITAFIIKRDGPMALRFMIETHLSENNLTDIENSCAFTSLSSDMNRSKAAHRGIFESHMDRVYDLFAQALHQQFPEDTVEQSHIKALNLYSGLVGTLSMARTMKNRDKALVILKSGREFLLSQFTRKD